MTSVEATTRKNFLTPQVKKSVKGADDSPLSGSERTLGATQSFVDAVATPGSANKIRTHLDDNSETQKRKANDCPPQAAMAAVTPTTRPLAAGAVADITPAVQHLKVVDSAWKGLKVADVPGIFSPEEAVNGGGSPQALYVGMCSRLQQARLMRQLRCGTTPSGKRAPKAIVRRTVYLIRHAQSVCNAEGQPVDVFDPALSPFGHDQINRMLHIFDDAPLPDAVDEDFLVRSEGLPGPSVILCSPLTRSLETARNAFQHLSRRGRARGAVPIVAMEELREVVSASAKAELRRTRTELEAEYHQVDFSLLRSDSDPLAPLGQDGGSGERSTMLKERAAKALHFLLHIEHENDNETPFGATLAVVSHFHLLNFLVERAVCSQGRYRSFDPATNREIFDNAAITQQFEKIKVWQSSWNNCGIVVMDLDMEDCGLRAKPRWKLHAVDFTPLSI